MNNTTFQFKEKSTLFWLFYPSKNLDSQYQVIDLIRTSRSFVNHLPHQVYHFVAKALCK